MLKRLGLGLFKGALIGVAVAALLVKGLGIATFGAVLAYVFAAATGALTGLIAGKPIWRPEAKIEAGLKALVGAGAAAAVMLLLRKWLSFDLDLSAFELGKGAVGELPAASLPLIASGLAMFFEIDNTEATIATDAKKARVAPDKQRVAESAEPDELPADVEAESRKARR